MAMDSSFRLPLALLHPTIDFLNRKKSSNAFLWYTVIQHIINNLYKYNIHQGIHRFFFEKKSCVESPNCSLPGKTQPTAQPKDQPNETDEVTEPVKASEQKSWFLDVGLHPPELAAEWRCKVVVSLRNRLFFRKKPAERWWKHWVYQQNLIRCCVFCLGGSLWLVGSELWIF